jgi:hypothetical protein
VCNAARTRVAEDVRYAMIQVFAKAANLQLATAAADGIKTAGARNSANHRADLSGAGAADIDGDAGRCDARPQTAKPSPFAAARL